MKNKPYVIAAVGVAVGLVTFLGSLVLSHRPTALPAQQAAEDPVELASSAAVQPTTTVQRNELLGAVQLAEPDPAEQRLLPSALRPLGVDCDDATVLTAPANDLAQVVAAAEAGTCFVFEPGEYRFHNVVPKDYMTFLGESRDSVVVLGSGDTENAFHGTATGVSIGRMTFRGFQGSGGEKRQEQAAIRGTAGIWLSDRGQMATEWLIEDIEASDNFANGVFIGDHFTVRNSLFARNGITGLGGSETTGGLIETNIVTENGAEQATGYLVNGGGMKFGQANSPDDPLVIRRNEVFLNAGIGVWCDIGCDGFHVIENYIHDQDSRAIMYELSSNALIQGNLLVDTNTWTDFNRDFNAAAITIGESRDVVVENNYIEGAEAGIIIRQTRRPVYPQEAFLDSYDNVTFVSQGVTVRNNAMIRAGAMGISLGATGSGLIPDLGSIRFDNNVYDDAGDVDFWWNGSRYDFNQWRDSGRDLQGGGSLPPRPVWTRTP